MSKLNPTAILFWIILGILGYLFFGTFSAVLTGVVIGMIISIIADML